MLGSSHEEEPMKPSQHTTEQIIKILEQAEKGEQGVVYLEVAYDFSA
jgi:hypothetical protein